MGHSSLLLPQFDLTRDLLLSRHTVTWTLDTLTVNTHTIFNFLGNSLPSRNPKQPSNTPSWDTQKGIADDKELFISGELNKRLELKYINLEKRLSKKVAHLLK